MLEKIRSGNAEATQKLIDEVRVHLRAHPYEEEAESLLKKEEQSYSEYQGDDVFQGTPRIGTGLGLKPEFYALTFLSWLSRDHIQIIQKTSILKA